jgi:PKD repeat protein
VGERFSSLKRTRDSRLTLLSNCNQHDRLPVLSASGAQDCCGIFSRPRRSRLIVLIAPLLFLLILPPLPSQTARRQRDVETFVPHRVRPALTDNQVELRVSPQTIEVGRPVSLVVMFQPTGPTTGYAFHFGDNSPVRWGPESEITHTYSSPGTYLVYAEIRGREGVLAHRIVKTVQKHVEVIPSQVRPTESIPPPVPTIRTLQVYLASDANHVRVGKSVIFSISTNDARPHAYELNFGDQIVQTRKNSIQHTFRTRGNYTVSVTVLDHPSHARATLGISVDQRPLEVYLSANANQVLAGESVTFSISTNDARPHAYELNFGDQLAQTRKNSIRHTFRTRGNYSVSVTVLDDPSHPRDKFRIRVDPPPPPWIYIVGALAAAVLLFATRKWWLRVPVPPPVPPPASVPPPVPQPASVPPPVLPTFHPHWASGTQQTKWQENTAINYELHFESNVSKGRFRLETSEPMLVTSIKRDND